MNIIFLTLLDISNINERGIYHDLLRKFRDEGHNVYVIYPAERRKKTATKLQIQENVHLLRVRTLNIQKTNIVEKGAGTLMLEYQYLSAFKKYFSSVTFDLVLYSTPPITLTSIIQYIKQKDAAIAYMLLKDIFPQNAVDLGMIKAGSLLHRFFTAKEKRLYEISDFIGCMSPANVEYLIKNNPAIDAKKIEVNPNSIDTSSTVFSGVNKDQIRNKYNIPSNALVCIYGGNLGKPQGIDFLIEVLRSNLNRKEVFFAIVGAGTEFNLLQKWKESNGPSNLMLLEKLPKKDYDQLVQAGDVGLIFLDKRFTIPNFPSRLLSYLEYKMPVIAATDRNTDIGQIVEDAGCGFWVEAGNVDAFQRKLNSFLEDQSLVQMMGERSYKLLEENYTVDISYRIIAKKIMVKQPPQERNIMI